MVEKKNTTYESETLTKQGLIKLYNTLKNINIDKLSAKLHIDAWSRESQLLFYLAILSTIFYVLAFFAIIPMWTCFLNFLITLIFAGFIFTRPDQGYNWQLVLVLFLPIVLVASPLAQSTLTLSNGVPEYYAPTLDQFFYYQVPRGQTPNLNDIYDVYGDKYYLNTIPYAFEDDPYIEINNREIEIIGEIYINGTAQPIVSYSDFKNAVGVNSGDFEDIFRHIIENVGEIGSLTPTAAGIASVLESFADIINWLLLLIIIGFGGVIAGDILTFQYDKAAKRAVYLVLALSLYTGIIAIFETIPGLHIKDVWETAGDSITGLLEKIGILQLDQNGAATLITPGQVPNRLLSYIPLVSPIFLFVFAFYFRHKRLESFLFARKLKEQQNIYQGQQFRTSVLALISIYMVYLVGYALINTDLTKIPGGENPLLSITFGILGILAALLVGFNLIYLHPKRSFWHGVKLTIFGFALLMFWFQVAQPAMLDLNDSNSIPFELYQGASLLDSDYLKQGFLVAIPETLIFQVLWIGTWNVVYYQVLKKHLYSNREGEITSKKQRLEDQRLAILKLANNPTNSNSRNLGLLIQAARLESKIDEAERDLRPSAIPHNKLIWPLIPSTIVGSFLFSHYHRFRRDISSGDWWNTPSGLIYAGAGGILSLICFFNLWAAIAVHWINNMMVVFLAS